MENFKLVTPVAFIIFNRPDTTERVFAEIARAKPPKLLVVSDGPRSNRAGEAELVAKTRAIIDKVDWDCQVVTNYSDINLGCKNRVSSGIDWVFQTVHEAIILEDDCLPDASFFRFCQEMLERYRDDKRIGLVSGDNFQFGRRYGSDSYYFSKYVHIWGWASWRDRWTDSYDVKLSHWPEIRDEGRLIDMVGNDRELSFWNDVFQRVYEDKIDTWDYQWVFANWLMGRSCILPSVNLITNIGFGSNATHTVGESEMANMPSVSMDFPLKHPIGIFQNRTADRYAEDRSTGQAKWKRIVKKIMHKFA
jgi:hypothetical protein